MPKKKRKGDVRQTLVEMPGGKVWELRKSYPEIRQPIVVALMVLQKRPGAKVDSGWQSRPQTGVLRLGKKLWDTPQKAAKRFGKFNVLCLADQEPAKEAEQARVEHDNAPCATCGHDRVHHMTGGLDCTRDDCRCSGYVQPQEQPYMPALTQEMVQVCATCGHTRYAHTTDGTTPDVAPGAKPAPCACRVCDCKCAAFQEPARVPAQEPAQEPAQPEPASQAATEKPTVDTSSAMAGALLVRVLVARDAATAAADHARFVLHAATMLGTTNRPLAYKLFGGAYDYMNAKAELNGMVSDQDRHARTLLCLSNDIHRPFPDPIE